MYSIGNDIICRENKRYNVFKLVYLKQLIEETNSFHIQTQVLSERDSIQDDQ